MSQVGHDLSQMYLHDPVGWATLVGVLLLFTAGVVKPGRRARWFAGAGGILPAPFVVLGSAHIFCDDMGSFFAAIFIVGGVIVGGICAGIGAFVGYLSDKSYTRNEPASPKCGKCGYSLVGLTGDKCPECGRTVSSTAPS